MFEDCKMLLFEQSENLDRIDLELEKAQNYTKKAVKRLEKQKKEHKKVRCVFLLPISSKTAETEDVWDNYFGADHCGTRHYSFCHQIHLKRLLLHLKNQKMNKSL